MPKAYTSMRDKFMSEGMGEDAAQTKAAKIYNANKNKGIRGFGAKLSNKPEGMKKQMSAQSRFEAKRMKQGAKRW